MKQNDYDELLSIIVDNAKNILADEPELRNDEDEFHRRLFADVLTEVDEHHPNLSKYEAKEISEVCGDIEGDIIHGDILGL
jgi:hypothetical protein